MNWRRRPSKRAALIVTVVGLAGALSAIGIASAATTVDIDSSKGLSPSKLPKKKYKPASLNVVVTSTTDNANGVPDPVTNTKLFFDDDGKVDFKGLKTCTKNLAGTTTAQAKDACKSSQIGSGTADVKIPVGTGSQTFTATVTAFNGKPSGSKGKIILHNRVDALGVTQILTGTIDPKGASGDFGTTLTVPVLPLPAGAQLSRFDVTVKKSWTSKGKKHNYVSARCHDSNKTLNMKGTFQLGGGATSPQNDTTTQKCTRS
jgi:hypothetical protein